MAGDSARSRSGEVYHWYTCPHNRYNPKTCNKKRVPKDWLEAEVLRILNTEILTDEFIEHAADAAVEYEKHFDNNSELDGLRLELKQTENKIRNVSAAIATGVITKTLPEMLAELEKQREQIETAIVKKSAGVHEFSRDAIVAYLHELKALSHKDAGSQRHLINACIKSIYVFDTDDPDSLRLVINMNYFDNDAEINHEEIVRIVSSPLHFAVTSRTTVHGRRLLLVRTIKKPAVLMG
jgi:septal ring factor EnvC (AmiA/AmiB activator)